MPQASPPQRTFGLGALLEFIAGLALTLALVIQLQGIGLLCALLGYVVLAAAHASIFDKDRESPPGQNQRVAVFLIALLALVLAAALPLAAAMDERGAVTYVLLAAELAFVACAIVRRVRVAARLRRGTEHE